MVPDTVLDAYPPLLRHILLSKEFAPLLRSPDRLKHRTEWRDLIRALTDLPPSSDQLAERFHTQWDVCHHFLRELVDDDVLLMPMLRVWLPRYDGPDLTLYRGENIDRFEAGRIGMAWSDKQETAEMFARGPNAVSKGGVILRVTATTSAIISGPSWHSSQWLGENEFTLDTGQLAVVTAIARFAPSL